MDYIPLRLLLIFIAPFFFTPPTLGMEQDNIKKFKVGFEFQEMHRLCDWKESDPSIIHKNM